MTHSLHATPTSATLARPLPPVASVLFRLAQTVAAWEERRLTRRRLATLDAHMLRDIGLTRNLAARECDKPFWRD
ncbi:MAG TPA: DUF1127 domain-containing protein [Paracoccaceae bacterium]|nr:DUF1127 domain-containing protein [Paracoccaceae bacterium]HMO70229.1 DUF1127 domain-containing protein [Paracoccaceae bacterium]